MKIVFIMLSLIFPIQIIAQEKIEIVETQGTISKGTHPGFSAIIPQAKFKDVYCNFKKYVKGDNKTKLKKADNEYYTPKNILPRISSDSLILYSTIAETQTGIQIVLYATKDDSAFISSKTDPVLSASISNYLRNFSVNEYRNAVVNELASEQENLQELENSLKGLDKNNDKFEKEIKSNERDIDRIREEIKENVLAQELKTAAIYQQQQALATFLEPSDLKKEEEKKLKTLEKEKRNLQKKNESLYKDIDKIEGKNREMRKKIDNNEGENIPFKEAEMNKQKQKILNIENKLAGIK